MQQQHLVHDKEWKTWQEHEGSHEGSQHATLTEMRNSCAQGPSDPSQREGLVAAFVAPDFYQQLPEHQGTRHGRAQVQQKVSQEGRPMRRRQLRGGQQQPALQSGPTSIDPTINDGPLHSMPHARLQPWQLWEQMPWLRVDAAEHHHSDPGMAVDLPPSHPTEFSNEEYQPVMFGDVQSHHLDDAPTLRPMQASAPSATAIPPAPPGLHTGPVGGRWRADGPSMHNTDVAKVAGAQQDRRNEQQQHRDQMPQPEEPTAPLQPPTRTLSPPPVQQAVRVADQAYGYDAPPTPLTPTPVHRPSRQQKVLPSYASAYYSAAAAGATGRTGRRTPFAALAGCSLCAPPTGAAGTSTPPPAIPAVPMSRRQEILDNLAGIRDRKARYRRPFMCTFMLCTCQAVRSCLPPVLVCHPFFVCGRSNLNFSPVPFVVGWCRSS
jgi:hypothetical protein